MKKTIIILGIFLIMIIPFVIAGNEYGKVTSGGNLLITDVDVKVDGLTSRNLEYGDDITRIANPSSKVEFNIEIKNNHSTLNMEEIEMIIEIEDLDLEDAVTEDELTSNQDKQFKITFTLPSDAEEGSYDVSIKAEGEQNNTIHKIEFEVDLEVEELEQEEETIISNPTSITDRLNSLNNTMAKINQEIGSYFTPYAVCVSERDSYKEQLNTKDTTINNLQGYETKFTECNNERMDCIVEQEKKSIANESCHYDIKNIYKPKADKNQSFIWIAFIVGALLVYGYYFYQEKWGKPKGESEKLKSDVS